MLKDLIRELKEKEKIDSLGWRQATILRQEWLKEAPQVCEKCAKTENLTLDHILPKEIVSQFGIVEEKIFMPENYRVLCKMCNMFKGHKLDFSTSRTKELLLELLKKV